MKKKEVPTTKTLIGLVGPMAGGKDTVAMYLVRQYGFTHVSSGDMLREHIRRQTGVEPDRQTMRQMGTQLRSEHGADFLIRRSLNDPPAKLVISGLRAIKEAEAIKNHGGMILACNSPAELRYQRMTARGRIGDGITFEEFVRQEEIEGQNTDQEAPNLAAVMALADHHLNNDGQLDALHQAIDDLMSTLSPQQQ